ncbi:outer membrane protein assembly factor BamB [Paenibacillus sp. PastF-3]|uniref:outer membrane protein assembly factor BamB family protein n=1 Tax=Paenibacillus sp. PastF-3 TaxID=2940626 RepID=UPI002476E8CF|nr:PQQ-binding-like beta-propeller repeat protein [Paenibacillus sp. PastF-3]MDH6372453.1 outer membrane protein assembly factor BamB [Paenibacillus sp. PastF-3]
MRGTLLKSCLRATVIGLGVLFMVNPVQAAAVDSHTSYIGSNFDDYYANLPAAKVEWSTTMDLPTLGDISTDYLMGKGVVAAGTGKAFILQKGQLLAINAQTGKVMWKYGSKLKAPILYQDGVAYVTSEAGTIYAVNAATGKNKWSSSANSKGISQLVIDKDQLFAANGDIHAFNLKDGKLQWRDNFGEKLYEPFMVEGNLILAQNSESGAYTYDILHAFNRNTGKELWNNRDYYFPITEINGTLITQRKATLFDALPLTTLDSLDVKTGKVVKTVVYNPANIDPNDPEAPKGGSAWSDGDRIFITGQKGVYSYPVNADPSTVIRDNYSYESIGDKLSYAAGPYDGRILFSNGQSIYGVKMANKSAVQYSGISNPIARFDLLGHGMYVAQTDGKLIAIDLISAKPMVQLKTSDRVFGPTLLESGMIIVQSKGKLTAFKEPQALKMK